MLKTIQVDTHTHTVLSGHAWSTLRENARAAAQRNLAGLCVTEHGYAMPGSGPFFLPSTQNMLPEYIEGVRIYYGVEANIVDLQGGLDIGTKVLFDSEFTIASMHDLCVEPGSPRENTKAYVAALAHPCVDMLGHIDDRKTPSDFEAVVAEAARLGKLIEINNNSLLIRKGSPERVEEIARLCARHGARVSVSSDAHFDEMVGSVAPALELLGRVDFPDELVVNRSADSFKEYMGERAARVDAARGMFAVTAESTRRRARKYEL